MIPRHRYLRILGVVILLLLAVPPGTTTQAQDEGFPISSASAYCEPGYFGPFVDCTPWEGVTVTLQSTDGSFSTTCVTSGTERAAICTVYVPFGSTIVASIDPSIIPDGYVLEKSVTQEIQVPDGPPEGEFSGPVYVLLPAAQDAPQPTDEPLAVATGIPATTAVPEIEEGGMGAAFFTGTCDTLDPDAPVARLNATRFPEGSTVGLEGAVPVATGYTVVPLPMDVILEGGHVLALFSEDDPTLMVACGAVGGVLDSNGALTIGLTPVEDPGMVGVAYLSDQDDGAATGISLFVMEQEAHAD
jgi:hypothetical protein